MAWRRMRVDREPIPSWVWAAFADRRRDVPSPLPVGFDHEAQEAAHVEWLRALTWLTDAGYGRVTALAWSIAHRRACGGVAWSLAGCPCPAHAGSRRRLDVETEDR